MEYAILFTIITVGIGLGAQRRADAKASDKRFEDFTKASDKRFEDFTKVIVKLIEATNQRITETNQRITETNQRITETNQRMDDHQRRNRQKIQALTAEVSELSKIVSRYAGQFEEVSKVVLLAVQAAFGMAGEQSGGTARKLTMPQQAVPDDLPPDPERGV